MDATDKATTAPTGKIRRQRCGNCVYCLRDDCGRCRNCLKKIKFGGNGRCKNACVKRQCQSMISYVVGQKTPNTAAYSNKSIETESYSDAEEITSVSSGENDKNTNDTTPSSHIKNVSIRKFMYGKPVPRNSGVCSGCNGVRDKEAAGEEILLCDGEGCNREFHIGCLDPPLEEVPEGEFCCSDCNSLGTTLDLLKYFQDWQDDRAMFKCSRDYVLQLIGSLMHHYSSVEIEGDEQETDSINNEEDKSTTKDGKKRRSSPSPVGKSKKKGKKLDLKLEMIPPESEIPRIQEFHSTAIGDDSSGKDLDQDFFGPEFLVGKPIRLYCPIGNSYHIGRIIDWRRATNLILQDDATTSSASQQLFYGKGDIASSEFLVRFLPGLDGRKKILYQWMILEEHSIAIGTTVIWGQIGNFRGMQGWKPAQILLRTSLELVPTAQEQKLKQLNDTEKKDLFAFTMFFGGKFYALVSLRKEATDFLSPRFHSQANISSIPTSPENANAFNTPTKNTKNMDISYAVAMAKAELEEQRRVKYWYKLPLKNATHIRALTLIDESSLPELKIPAHRNTKDKIKANFESTNSVDNDDKDVKFTTTIMPKLCPLIPLGLDRIWFAETIGNMEESLDCLNSITVKPVSNIQSAIAQLHREF